MNFLPGQIRSELPIYRPEIDGLRALAVLPVVFFHAGAPGFSGGYVGVDVFFVISGYLITAIVSRAIARGDFSFIGFYERRIRRIFPALFVVLAVSTIAALVLFPPLRLAAYGRSLVAVALFIGNIFFYRGAPGSGYFETRSVVEPLLHCWSLAIEEQFYLLLPVGLVLIHRWARTHLKFALIAAAACSLAFALWLEPVAAFYLLPARAWELLVGSLLAVGAFPELTGRVQREIAAVLGVSLIAGSVLLFNRDTGYYFPYALVPCLGAMLIIHASDGGSTAVQRALSARPLIFVGAISYSLYLWHWPLFLYARYFEINGMHWQMRASLLVASLFLAVVSYYWIELPFRRSDRVWPRPRIFRWSAGAMATALAAGIVLVVLQGLPQRFDADTRALIAANEVSQSQAGTRSACWHWHDQVQEASAAASCAIGAEQPRKMLFWGDSHLAMLLDSIQRLHDQGAMGPRQVLLAIDLACTPTQTIVLLRPNTNCGELAHFTMLRASQSDIDTVFIAFATWWVNDPARFCIMVDGACRGGVSSGEEIQSHILGDLAETIARLRSLGKTVVVSLPFPGYDSIIPDLEIHNAMFARYGSMLAPRRTDPADFREKLRAAVLAQGGTVFDPQEGLCPGKDCLYQIDGVSLYRDDSHLSIEATTILDRSLAAVLRATQTP